MRTNYTVRAAKMGRIFRRLGWFGAPIGLLMVIVANDKWNPEAELTRPIGFGMFLGFLLPILFFEGLALIWPKVRTMRCHRCRWEMDFPWVKKR